MTKTDRRIEELTDEVRKLREQVERLNVSPRFVPYPVYPPMPWYPSPLTTGPIWIAPHWAPTCQPLIGGTITYGSTSNATTWVNAESVPGLHSLT